MNAAKKIGGLAVTATALVGLGGCPLGQDYMPLILPACVSGFQAGDSLTVRIGAVYDATSDYVFEYENFGPLSYDSVPSCAGLDGVTTGSLVTFKLTGQADGSGRACSPWTAAFEPEIITNKKHASAPLPYLDGVTIADATAFGSFDGSEAVFAARGLFTPSGDPDGAFVTGTLPPLAVTRNLSFDKPVVDNHSECFDAWVATWEPAP